MYIRTYQVHFGQPAPPSIPPAVRDRWVRHFTCSPDDLNRIGTLTGKTVSEDILRSALAQAVRAGLSMTNNAVRLLRKSPRSPARRALFREIFGTFPEVVPKWAPNPSWVDLGGLVALRLQRAVEVLAGGSVHYYCWGCPGGDRDPASYSACNHPCGKYIIGLGQGFWNEWRDGNFDLMGMILVHEALHIYFCSNIKDAGVGRYGNAYCYQRFVPEINGRFLYPHTEKACPSILRRGSRGPEVRKLQQMLNDWQSNQPVTMALPAELSRLEETGVFDRQTENNVRVFQQRRGLEVDGVAGSETWQELLSLVN